MTAPTATAPDAPTADAPRVTALAPQLLVDDLARAIAFYRRIGFAFDAPWRGIYAIGVIDGLELHLKAAPIDDAARRARARRRDEDHLDAAVGVDGIEAFHARCVARGVPILRPLCPTPWGTLDFYVEDPDGHVLAFGGRPAVAR